MTEMRPTSIYVIGLLNLVIAAVGVVWVGIGTISLLAGGELASRYFNFSRSQMAEMAAIDGSLADRVPHLFLYRLVATQLIPWLLIVGLIAGGIGLLQCRPWARSVSILYALLSILHKIGIAVYTYVFLLPIYKTPISILQLTKPHLAPGADVVANITSIVIPVLLMFYPILVLIVMNRPAVAAALSGRPAPEPAAA